MSSEKNRAFLQGTAALVVALGAAQAGHAAPRSAALADQSGTAAVAEFIIEPAAGLRATVGDQHYSHVSHSSHDSHSSHSSHSSHHSYAS